MSALLILAAVAINSSSVTQLEAKRTRVSRACSEVDESIVAAGKRNAQELAESGVARKHIVKGMRKWAQENALGSAHDRCVVALADLALSRRAEREKQEERRRLEKLRESLTDSEIRWLRYVEISREEAIEKARVTVRMAKSHAKLMRDPKKRRALGRSITPGVFRIVAPSVKSAKKALRSLIDNPASHVPQIDTRMKIGDMGRLMSVRVTNVASESELLGEVGYRYVSGGGISQEIRGVDTWISGIDGSLFIDGKSYSISGIFEVVGNKQYTTAIGGTRTVFHVVKADIDRDKLVELGRHGMLPP